MFSDLVYQVQKQVWKDNDYKEVLKRLARGESVPDYSLETQATLLFFTERVVFPSNQEIQLDIPQQRHNSPLAGHPGHEKTLNLIKSDLYWSGMNQIIKYYASSFHKCSRKKNIHNKKFGLIKPL
ncbi:hypothetical protein O181_046792 [Austropuccinia psidii MF-1]|uniref:Integrase zinc-binding domain-containing protein n=1 Tax=Austropuccinia psidii MF-1 TaxID=1389203 RepID=A0A9Q3DWM3_9BASI|nr:hypothetical protein [Austropuccinia psidii MF-1]